MFDLLNTLSSASLGFVIVAFIDFGLEVFHSFFSNLQTVNFRTRNNSRNTAVATSRPPDHLAEK